MRILVWLLRAFIFFSLFAFALNNQHSVSLQWFFGYAWSTRMVFVVLAAFASGVVFGVLVMAPPWWRQRRLALQALPQTTGSTDRPAASAPAVPPSSVNDLTDASAHGI